MRIELYSIAGRMGNYTFLFARRFQSDLEVAISTMRHIALCQVGERLKDLMSVQAFAEQHEGAVEVFARGPDILIRASPARLLAAMRVPNSAAASSHLRS